MPWDTENCIVGVFLLLVDLFGLYLFFIAIFKKNTKETDKPKVKITENKAESDIQANNQLNTQKIEEFDSIMS